MHASPEEAITILLERAFPGESKVGAQDRVFALKFAKRCLFREISCSDVGPTARSFHPLALKAFGGYLMSKYGSNLLKWVAEVDGMVYGSGDALDEVFAVLCKAFDDMDPTYQTIFILLAVYRVSNMPPHKVIEWLAISCNEEIKCIEKAVKVLQKKAFIEISFEAEIRMHDLYIGFAQSIAKRMERWLWWKGDGRSTRGLISKFKAGFEFARLEQCMYRRPSQIAPTYLQNLFVLQLVGVANMVSLDLGMMKSLRSMTLHNCKSLAALEGMENLPCMAWLQIKDVNPKLQLPHLSSLHALQYLEIDIADSGVVNELGDLTPCLFLREIVVCCPSLLKFPRVNGLSYLEKVEFSKCDKVKSPLDCTDCVELQSVVLTFCSQMAALPLLAGCKKLSNIVLSDCDAVTLELQIPSEAASAPKTLESCYGLKNLELRNMGELIELPSFEILSNLTVLKLGMCGIREPPDLTCCVMLEDVSFYSLRNLKRFPNFSLLRELKKLSICDCITVEDAPDMGGCHKLQVFHLLYNDNMNGLPKILAVSNRRDFGTTRREYEDGNWLNKVQRYFDGSAVSELGDEKEVTFSASEKLEKVYDAFILGAPDVKENVAFALYDSLAEKGFCTFPADQELKSGDTIEPFIRNAIYSSKVQIAIFSPRYAYSSWCLNALVDMLKTEALFIPVFCDVRPSDLRYLHKGIYAEAFAKHEEKGGFSKVLQQWTHALHSSSLFSGYEFWTSNDNVEMLCLKIALTVQKVVGKTSMGFPWL